MFVFGAGQLYGIQTADAAGNAVTNPTPVQFGTLQEVSGDLSFESKSLYGQNQFPVAIGRGKGKLSFKAKVADLNGALLGNLLFGQGSSSGIKATTATPATAIPTTPFKITVTPPNSGTFTGDLGVINVATAQPMTRVASAPAAGQYSVDNLGAYTFASADNVSGVSVIIAYEYTATSTTAQYGTISNQLMGYAPTFQAVLAAPYQGKQFTLKLNNCISSKLSFPLKNEDFMVPEFTFDASADAAGNIGFWAIK